MCHFVMSQLSNYMIAMAYPLKKQGCGLDIATMSQEIAIFTDRFQDRFALE